MFDHQQYLETVSESPGIYQMLNESGEILYVGKAKNLKKRITSYFRRNLDNKTIALINKIADIKCILTKNETEALILENTLIKEHRPRYNILLKDDKSYPYIYLSEHNFPRFSFHRGAKKKKGRYFGPYPSAAAVRDTLGQLQKLFKIRQCEDSFFQNRSRPCLQYQIKRCVAPCVNLVNEKEYAEAVNHSVLFLEGKSNQLIDFLVEAMDQAAEALQYERAAELRDSINNLRRIQEKQYVGNLLGEADVIAVVSQSGVTCVQIFYFRNGNNLGNKVFFPSHTKNSGDVEVLEAFLGQYYLDKPVPKKILINHDVPSRVVLQNALQSIAKRDEVEIIYKKGQSQDTWMDMAETNALTSLQNHLNSKMLMDKKFEQLQSSLNLSESPQRLECYDVSHTQGSETVASCVVFDRNGPLKSDYRRFNIIGLTPGDDYAAMLQVLQRRFRHAKEKEAVLPDVLIIDGGKGQLSQGEKAMQELGIEAVTLLAVSKGPSRKAGLEKLYLSGNKLPIILASDSSALHLIQHIRDEAHRFAIAGHRARREKKTQISILDEIPGIGPRRRQVLLKQFGGLRGLQRATQEELGRISGISRELAERIYQYLHQEDLS